MSRQRPFLAVYGLLRRGDQVLMIRRANTGYGDGFWSLPAGHVEEDEPLLAAASREMWEEVGVTVAPQDWRHRLTMHRRSDRLGLDVFLEAAAWSGTPENREPEKCDGLAFHAADHPPEPTLPFIRAALTATVSVLEFGWDHRLSSPDPSEPP